MYDLTRTQQTTLLVGCDDTSILPAILDKLQEKPELTYLVAIGTLDLVRLINRVNPFLILLISQDERTAVQTICEQSHIKDVPILCLTQGQNQEFMAWDEQFSIFLQPLEFALKRRNLTAWINSFLMLKNAKKTQQKALMPQQSQEKGKSRQAIANSKIYVLELDQKNGALIKIKDQLLELSTQAEGAVRQDLITLTHFIKRSISDNKYWEEFKVLFRQDRPQFLSYLRQKHPSLTPLDLKYCCYLVMELTNDDICHILGINLESVRTHKYRLKKKLKLNKKQDLYKYLKALANQ